MKKYINAFLTLASIAMIFYIVFDQKVKIKQLKSQNKSQLKTIDSLEHNNIVIQHENDIYDIVVHNISEQDSVIANMITEAINNAE